MIRKEAVLIGDLQACSQDCAERLLASSCLFVCLSVLMERLGFHWWDFHEMLYLWILRKICEEVQLWLKSDKHIGHFTMQTFVPL